MASKTRKKQQATQVDQAAGQPNGQAVQLQVPSKPIHFEQTFETYPAGAYTHEELGLSREDLLAIYRNMLLQRRFEERAAQMYGKQKIAGFLHLYIGEEAVSTGAAWSIKVGHDSVITAYRDHGIALALGMTANECMAELFGKIDGCSRGKGGSMHFFKAEKKFFGGHGIVGGHVPLGVGIAFAHKYKEDGGVCLTFFGDGAMGQGTVHEAMNLAALYKLPIIFIIENNQYAMGTAVWRAFANTEFYRYAASYNMPGALVDGMDVFSVMKALRKYVALAREYQPSVLEVRTYRYRGHSMSDPAKYRTKEELEAKKKEDPIIRLKSYMLQHGLSTNEELDAIDDEVKKEVQASVEFAEKSPFPPLESIYEDVYVQPDYPFLA
ncbi:pyruvate dehydrogenase (acetyl-transferring) E1 component subunit alpha [Rhodothermus marinus]|uniref:Pyruvate dehydrogenase E1 component subunit alpha n=1 Tax=Rhodothermus marinus (strain ATCC 43812 / DSM 4252 / R-10) TaxID=518766 RepID=D0MIH9_RHOM4|nr:pyruvate dehydrogenase (acetyl-transferring) E1 component subunit alpha [Rhodothermus marinus]ACY48287.1 pyruvate dehydrogenase (acetyl-transferring) E1 component, alpha subunit [Rhodothermus marinus DSM 4252]